MIVTKWILPLLWLLCSQGAVAATPSEKNQWVEVEKSLISELTLIVAKLKGGDKRLLRFNALEHTHSVKEEEGMCDKLHHALLLLVEDVSQASEETKFLICEMATLCITDHPSYRNVFSGVEGVYETVVYLAKSANPRVAAKAAHLIYIASYAHKANHESFFENGAVEVLSEIVKARRTKPVVRMFAMAALQNLAASYCTYTDGYSGSCEWGWKLDKEHVTLVEEDQTLLVDGSAVRQTLARDKDLFDVLKTWICTGPVVGEPSDENVHPGFNGVSTGRDDNNPAIVPWAAAGLLKNLALEPTTRPMVEQSIVCLCEMSDSADPLENSKAENCLHFIRREGDPCWFSEDNEILDCIDRNFLDEGYSTCEDYSGGLDDDCDAHKDIFTGLTARLSCCACGGGYQLGMNSENFVVTGVKENTTA